MANMDALKSSLIEHAMSVGALKFGTFTLKSGRISPYFFNASFLCTGPILSTLSQAYCAALLSQNPYPFPSFSVLFGPAYKGIPFASTTALTLSTHHNVSVGFAYDRKEPKDHGEGGSLVGVSLSGKNVVILDDVMTSGKAIRSAIDLVTKNGGHVVGVVQLLDRQEIGQETQASTVLEIQNLISGQPGSVRSILKMQDLMDWLERNGKSKELADMREYWDKYGLKD